MKKIILSALLALASLPLPAQAGVYTLSCQNKEGDIRVELGDLLVVNQDIEVDQGLVKVTLPADIAHASIKLQQDFFHATEFEVLGNSGSEFFNLSVKGRRYTYQSWQARGDEIIESRSGSIRCVVRGPDGRRVR